MFLASVGLFWMHSFICFMSSNICSGGRDATAREMASGAFSGSTASPYGELTASAVAKSSLPVDGKEGEREEEMDTIENQNLTLSGRLHWANS